MTPDMAYDILFKIALLVFLTCILAAIVRSVIGPEICDRIVSVNMVGTNVISGIAVLSCMLGESYLCDISLIYVLISFVAVCTLAKVYIRSKKGGK